MTSSHLQIPTPSTPSGWKPSLPSTKATPPTPLRSWQMCLDLAGTTTLLGVKKQAVKQHIAGIAVWFQVNKVDKSQVKVKSSSYRPIDRYLLSIGKSILKCPIKVEPNCNGAHFLGYILIKKYLGNIYFFLLQWFNNVVATVMFTCRPSLVTDVFPAQMFEDKHKVEK